MNGNRMKYSSTPTYGMQKRFPLGKKPLFQQKSVMGPDFARATQQSTAAPAASLFTMPVQQPNPAAQTVNPGQAGVPYGSVPYQQPFAGGYPMGGMTPGAIPAANPWMPVSPLMPQQSSNLPPLGNTVNPLQNSGFGAHAQGFVPPQAAPSPSVQPASAPGAMGHMPQTPVQPMNPMPNVGYMQAGAPFLTQGTMRYAPVNPAMMQQSAAAQAGSMPGTPQNIPMQGGVPLPGSAQQGGYAPKQRKPLDFNLLFGIFLFGLLPLLFVPCIFVSTGLNFLRYLFIGLSVAGLGVVWYRQMYSSTARVALSVVYVALCIIALSLSMQGGRDLRQTASGSVVPASAQNTSAPDQSMAPAAAEITPTPSPEPTPAGKPEVQLRLEAFMNNWAGNQTEAMASLVQPSWASQQENAAAQLFQTVLNNRTPLSYNIEEVGGTDDDTSRSIIMTASIDKHNGKDPKTYRFNVLMVKEGNQWYVDPNSLASNDEQQTEDVVVNSKDNVTETEAPRTTVSPAPPASTLLYYNANGGHYYHMDANCSSIDEQYRPLTDSFPYSELGSYINSLNPCLVCGAPTSTLPTEAPAE